MAESSSIGNKSKPSSSKPTTTARYNRIFKKTSQDGNMVLFLPQREITITEECVEPMLGIALVNESVVKSAPDVKVYLQVMLIFRQVCRLNKTNNKRIL